MSAFHTTQLLRHTHGLYHGSHSDYHSRRVNTHELWPQSGQSHTSLKRLPASALSSSSNSPKVARAIMIDDLSLTPLSLGGCRGAG